MEVQAVVVAPPARAHRVAPLQHDGRDAVALQRRRDRQAGGTRADDGDVWKLFLHRYGSLTSGKTSTHTRLPLASM